jgi:phage recombination protein Bet
MPDPPTTLAKPATPIAMRVFGAEKLEIVKSMYAVGATNAELEVLAEFCDRTGLSLFAKQVHAIKRWDQKQRREVMAIQIAIDGQRLIAERTGKFRGRVGPYWCGKDGEWKDVWLAAGNPAAAKVGVLRAGSSEPTWAVARWESYAQTYSIRDAQGRTEGKKLMPTWEQMPDVMLAKCAEAQALRAAFPGEMSGFRVADVPNDEDLEQAGERQARNAQRYTEIFGDGSDEGAVVTNGSGQQVDRATGEVLDPAALDLAMTENARLVEEALAVGAPVLKALRADKAWPVERITDVNRELGERIKSRQGEIDRQFARQSGQAQF